MKALVLFHLRVGTRVALRSFVLLFAGLVCVIILQMYPVAFVTSIALRFYALRPAPADRSVIIASSLCFAFWAMPQLLAGLHGWVRHLPLSAKYNRRALVLGLVAAQLPLAVSLLLLAAIAHTKGLAVALPLVRYCVVLTACACAAAPVRRHILTVTFGIAGAFFALSSGPWALPLAAGCVILADVIAGPLRKPRRRRNWRPATSHLEFRISCRALGWRPAMYYVLCAIPVGAAALFISNNELTGAYAHGSARFGGALATLVLVAGIARQLALRRPPWPLARSFPWSAAQRVGEDAVLLGAYALPLLVLVYWLDSHAVLGTAAVLPVLSVRAAGNMRLMPARRIGMGAFVLEGFVIAGSCALVAWSPLIWLAATPFVFYFARRAELYQKVTRWLELHYASVGDSLSWSD